MSDDVLLDHAAQLIADARVACLKLAVPPEEIAKIMMDEAILALMAERLSLSESVRRLQAGLQSFLSMRRIEARRKNASAFRLRFSQSLASLRQRLNHAIVRSTIQRLGNTTNPLT